MLRSAAQVAQKARFPSDENDRLAVSAVLSPCIAPSLNHHQGLSWAKFCPGATGGGCLILKLGWQVKNEPVSAWQQAAGLEDKFNSPEV